MNHLTHTLAVIGIVVIALLITIFVEEVIEKKEPNSTSMIISCWVGWSAFLITLYYTCLI